MSEYAHLRELSINIWERFYKIDSPAWEPLNDSLGVITQISNMVCGLERKDKLNHVDSENCWCEPELNYEDPETGNRLWVHRDVQ